MMREAITLVSHTVSRAHGVFVTVTSIWAISKRYENEKDEHSKFYVFVTLAAS